MDLELELVLEMDFGLTGCAEPEVLLDFDISGKSSSSEVSKRLLLDGFDGFLAKGCLDGFELGLLNREKYIIKLVHENRKMRKSMEKYGNKDEEKFQGIKGLICMVFG